jgi:uncharacterized cupredoxin-like copper-binding protein
MVALLPTGAAVGQSGASHPAHLHVGACPAPGDVVAPLESLSADLLVDGTPSAGELIGPEPASPVVGSVTTVPLPLADIAAGGHALVVHESADAMGTYIACGDVGGRMLGDDRLVIALAELSESGYTGVAWLTDNGDGTTTVSAFLTRHATEVAVTLQEWSVIPAVASVDAGAVIFKANNVGPEDPHELVIVRTDLGHRELPTREDGGFDEDAEGVEVVAEIEEFDPGLTESLTLTLPAGKYVLLCNLVEEEDGVREAHYTYGMSADFLVE